MDHTVENDAPECVICGADLRPEDGGLCDDHKYDEQSETRTRRRMRKAVESRGFKVLSMEYEPWYNGGEMVGLCGGWTVLTDRPREQHTNYGDEATGYSADEVLAYIDYFFKPSEPCECYPDDRSHRCPLTPIKGDPQHGMHEPDCRWFIKYQLPWWTSVIPPEVGA